MPSYPTPPLVTSQVPYKFTRTPILIEVVAPVILADQVDVSAEIQPLVFRITSPTSRLHGPKQTLQEVSRVVVPGNGVIRLLMVPSDLYKPTGRYKVEVFEGSNKIPRQTMTWVVPYAPNPVTVSIVHNSDGPDDLTNDPIYQILSVSHPGEYQLVNNQILWTQDPPAIGSSYRVTYQPAISLDQLIVDTAG